MPGSLANSALITPAEHAFVITPADGVDLEASTRGIWVGTTGNLRVRMVDGGDIMFIGMVAGMVHPLRVIRVWATGSTATGIRGLR